MAQYDVYKIARNTLAVDLQSDYLGEFDTRVVAPLEPASRGASEAVIGLKPILTINGKDYIFLPTDITTVHAAALKNHREY